MTLTGLDVAAIVKLLTQPICDEERLFIRTMKTYIAEQGGSDAILHRSAKGGGGEHHSGSTGITVGGNTIERIRSGMADPTGTDKDNAVDGIPADEEDTTTDGTNRPSSSTMSGPIILSAVLTNLDEKSLIENSFVNTEILTYLDEKSLIEASFVNKQWHANCHNRSMTKQPIVPYFRLTWDVSSGFDAITNFVRNMKRNFRFRELLRNGYQRFELHFIGDRPIESDKRYEERMRNAINATSQIVTEKDETHAKWFYNRELMDKFRLAIDEMAHTIRMDGIVSLVITASNNTKRGHLSDDYWHFFSKMFPQIRTLNILDPECNRGQLLNHDFDEFFGWHNPHLTTLVFQKKDRQILWCGINQDYWYDLKEIYIDDHTFVFDDDEDTIETLQFLDYYSSDFKKLERLSIRNARYLEGWPKRKDTSQGKKLPQHYLIEFVRNAPPALIWLRSDLSQANIKMLKLERPNIDFVN